MAGRGWPGSLSIADRIQTAEERMQQIVDNLLTLIHLHETNRIICYSDKLASQIPRSYAGHHFQLFRYTMLKGEALRLCTLWDSAKKDRMSLPTITALINDNDVLNEMKLRDTAHKKSHSHAEAEGDDPELLAWMQEMSDAETLKEAADRDATLRKAITDVEAVAKSSKLTAIRQFRDWHIAHSLDAKAKVGAALPYFHGYERDVLEQTIPIVDDLFGGICRTSFMWDDGREMAQEYARALWDGCRFEVLE